jgi:hypothetical protein
MELPDRLDYGRSDTPAVAVNDTDGFFGLFNYLLVSAAYCHAARSW